MKILSIETSCDETAVSIVEAEGVAESPSFEVLGNALFSQAKLHEKYGGVFPTLAKREHAKNLTPLLLKALEEANELKELGKENFKNEKEIENILAKEHGLFQDFKKYLEKIDKPKVDVIFVTNGPGLEPALWVGISFALALGKLWDIPVVPVNHMEGHIASVLVNSNESSVQFPALALLISGGHTEIVYIEKVHKYKILGKTVDDAVGEAYDKTARMLGLPYPGGIEISKLAQYADEKDLPRVAKLPRPLIHSKNYNFSFSGLKTAVLYYLRDNFGDKELSLEEKSDIAREVDEAILEVLTVKTKRALDENPVKTLIVAGGVIGNPKLREAFMNLEKEYNELKVRIPEKTLSTDNSIMIACAGYIKLCLEPDLLTYPQQIRANGNLELN